MANKPNQKLHIIFSHGKESGPWGSKIKSMSEYLQQICECSNDSIDYRDLESPDKRVERLNNKIKSTEGKILLIGSSMGGYVSTMASNHNKVTGLMLLAPAFYLPGYKITNPKTTCKNISIIQGWNDAIVPYQNSIKFAHQHKASLKLVNDGHRLKNSLHEVNAELGLLISKLDLHEKYTYLNK